MRRRRRRRKGRRRRRKGRKDEREKKEFFFSNKSSERSLTPVTSNRFTFACACPCFLAFGEFLFSILPVFATWL